MSPRPLAISVIGGGSFGTAIAAAAARSGHAPLLFCRDPAQADEISASGENRKYFPGFALPGGISATKDLNSALAADLIFLAVPARFLDHYVDLFSSRDGGPVVVNLAKGLHESHFTFAALFRERAPETQYVALKGPTFAKPMFLGELSALTCGTASERARGLVEEAFRASQINLDHSDSPDSVDTVSALKNIYAIAIGMGASLGFSDNTQFLLVSQVLKEMQAILRSLDLDEGVLLSYSGLGDTLLTGLCDTSRNRTFGFMLGRGLHIDETKGGFLAEGVRAIHILRCRVDIALPLLDMIVRILEGAAEPLELLHSLRVN